MAMNIANGLMIHRATSNAPQGHAMKAVKGEMAIRGCISTSTN